jgi:hypothetical protein
MDPDACLMRIAGLLCDSAHDDEAGIDLDWACQDLYDWLDRGGSVPNWEVFPVAASYYATRAVVHKRGERMKEGE